MEQGVKLIAVNCVILLQRAFPSLLDDFFLGGGGGRMSIGNAAFIREGRLFKTLHHTRDK